MKFTLALCLATAYPAFSQTVSEYFNTFPFKPLDITIDSVRDHLSIDVDQKNAFIDVQYEEAEYDYQYRSNFQFTYFVKADRSKIFALSHLFSGPSSDRREIDFYTNNGKWVNVTPFVLPKITLSDFDPESPYLDSVGWRYQIELRLPRIGTDLTLVVLPIELYDLPMDRNYPIYISSFPELILKWNREKGLFEKKVFPTDKKQ